MNFRVSAHMVYGEKIAINSDPVGPILTIHRDARDRDYPPLQLYLTWDQVGEIVDALRGALSERERKMSDGKK